jgi:hypothetical protein
MVLLPGCSCCGSSACADTSLPFSDPENEGTWVPSGTFPSIVWTFVPYSPETPGNTWFFSGSPDGGTIAAERIASDWFNPCNWWSHRTVAPSEPRVSGSGTDGSFTKRATRLPPSNAVVHIYTDLVISSPVSVQAAYFWRKNGAQGEGSGSARNLYNRLRGGTMVATGTVYGANAGFWLEDTSITANISPVELNGNVAFRRQTRVTTSAGAPYFGFTVNGDVDMAVGASGPGCDLRGAVNGYVESRGRCLVSATISAGAKFYDDSTMQGGTISGGAEFYDTSRFTACTFGVAPFTGQVNGGATFFDDARSCCVIDSGGRKFSAHPTELPTCSGTAPAGTPNVSSCGCA